MFLFCQTWGYSQDSTYTQKRVSWQKYELNSKLFYDSGAVVHGSMHLAVDEKGDLMDSINQFIVQQTAMLMFEAENAGIATDNYTKLFYVDLTSGSNIDSPVRGRSNATVFGTSVFTFEQIVSYSVTAGLELSKRPPEMEFINFDLVSHDTIYFDDLLRPVRSYDNPTFNDVLMNYVLKNKKKITDNYFKEYLKDWSDIYARAAQEFYESDSYNHDRVTFHSESSMFSHFDSDGMWFNVQVKDYNFLENEKRNVGGSYVYDYQTKVKVPYQLLDGFLEEENSLYPVLKRLMKQQ